MRDFEENSPEIALMNITYFYRNNNAGFSIAKVFSSLVCEISKSHTINEYFVPNRRADPLSLIKNIIYVFKNRNKNGINHITGDIHYCMISLIGCKTVLTIHDLSMYDCETNPVKKAIIKLFWFSLPVLLADRVVCISDHTRSELLKLVSSEKISVIHNPIDSSFRWSLKPFKENCPRILQIGTSWNKNLDNVIESIKGLPCLLSIVGQLSIHQRSRLSEYKIKYETRSNISDHEILEEYLNCDIVSFCSIYEGFGMPIIEGNSIGRCVITSNIEPLLDISAGAACIVDPSNVVSIRNGIIKIISDPVYRDNLILEGKKNVRRFDAGSIAKSYLSIYSTIKP